MISIKNVTKKYGRFIAVNDLSFDVHPGEVLGFMGPNGAGKTTTMRMITGFLSADHGSITVFGKDVVREAIEAKSMIGYLPEGAPCYGDMSVFAYLKFIAGVRGFKGLEQKQKVEEIVKVLNLESVAFQRISTLSKGFKRRVGLAQAIIHDPKVLILDEPTDGLDPNQKHQVRALIKNLAKDRIVIISTHILEEITAVCSRALVIANGQIVTDCEPKELEEKSKYHNAMTLSFKENVNVLPIADIEKLPFVDSVEIINDNALTVFAKDGEMIVKELHQFISQQSYDIDNVVSEKGRLDEVFRNLTEGSSS